MARGLLPRSFRIDPADSLYGTPFQTSAYSYDSALALIATVRRPALANEDLIGIISSIDYPSTLPFAVNHMTAAPFGSTIMNNANAITAYALGYYMEMNPNSSNYCSAEEYLRNLLSYLNSQRNWVNCYGLITDGREPSAILTEGVDYILTEDAFGILVTENSLASMVRTEDNILAWYAFKQAAKIFNEPIYQGIADEFKNAIMQHLWSDTESKFWFGLTTSGSPISLNVLMVSAYGSLFMSEIGEQAKALLCLNKCEVFNCIDSSLGTTGYKTWIQPTNHVNFEMSYATALGYLRVDNSVKYSQIINELNLRIDPSDGGQVGALLKNYEDENLIRYKAVGSTAWAIIANNLEATAFTIRGNDFNPVADCGTAFWFNDMQHQVFTKQGCPLDTHGSDFDYVVPAGRYCSYISPADANNQALAEIAAQGQDYVNTNGSCLPDAGFGNVYMEDFFLNQTCPTGTTPTLALEFEVAPNTFYASTQAAANALASDYLYTAGQAYANANGPCSSPSGPIHISLQVRVQQIGPMYTVFAKAFSSAPMPVNVRVYYQIYADTMPGTPVLVPSTFLQFTAGDFQTPEKNAGNFNDSGSPVISGVITNVTPNHYGSTLFTW
ncbi:MAG: DUF5977 domain-containing protein [Ferruginibacter sp.]